MECSPSTPTMNSYFYKFMINLLKRFSSERKLLETRGAFIIRSEPCCPAGTSRPGWAGRKGSVLGSLTSPGAGALFGSLPG